MKKRARYIHTEPQIGSRLYVQFPSWEVFKRDEYNAEGHNGTKCNIKLFRSLKCLCAGRMCNTLSCNFFEVLYPLNQSAAFPRPIKVSGERFSTMTFSRLHLCNFFLTSVLSKFIHPPTPTPTLKRGGSWIKTNKPGCVGCAKVTGTG